MNLRQIISDAADENGRPMKDYTVLSDARDPYRLDTPANHVLGQWLADVYESLNITSSHKYLRGMHYLMAGQVRKPDGELYTNNDETWVWFSAKVAKAARWLGYLPWDLLRDNRNTPPQIFYSWDCDPYWHIKVGEIQVQVPENISPEIMLLGDVHRQPVQQVVIAEKQGVEDLVLPVCKRYHATLAMPSGEISTRMLYDILNRANTDGRPLAIHQLADFDPSGNQMAVSTSRTVQALIDTQFPDLEAYVHAPLLTRDQCEEWNLPSTPLKPIEKEKRGSKWRDAYGWEQTELDAAIVLAPDAFTMALRQSMDQYDDDMVILRNIRLREKLVPEAQKMLDAQLDTGSLESIRILAEEKVGQINDLVKEVNEALHVDPYDLRLETPEIPDIVYGGTARSTRPLFDSTEGFAVSSRRLIARKQFKGDT